VGQILTWRALLEIALLAIFIYSVLVFLRGSRGAGILRGLAAVLAIVVIIFLTMAEYLELPVLDWLITNVLGYLVLALVIIFQPELRSALVRVGQSPVFTSFIRQRWDASEQITRAVMAMARERTGALIALQRSVGLKTFTEGGIRLDAQVSAQLLISIFRKGTPLHDGAVVIRGDRVLAAACLFPLSENPNIDVRLGTRHRAAVGVTEESDAVAVVVSEETGDISIAQEGSLMRAVDEKRLRKVLHAVSSEEGFLTAPAEEAT
jgi:diadenylate cyclase